MTFSAPLTTASAASPATWPAPATALAPAARALSSVVGLLARRFRQPTLSRQRLRQPATWPCPVALAPLASPRRLPALLDRPCPRYPSRPARRTPPPPRAVERGRAACLASSMRSRLVPLRQVEFQEQRASLRSARTYLMRGALRCLRLAYSMTRSARRSVACGIVSPNAFAVLMLMATSVGSTCRRFGSVSSGAMPERREEW